MGGVSESNTTVGSSELAWDGEVKIVPSLDAPGFCLIYTEGINRFADASAYSALTLKVNHSGSFVLSNTVFEPLACICSSTLSSRRAWLVHLYCTYCRYVQPYRMTASKLRSRHRCTGPPNLLCLRWEWNQVLRCCRLYFLWMSEVFILARLTHTCWSNRLTFRPPSLQAIANGIASPKNHFSTNFSHLFLPFIEQPVLSRLRYI